MPDLAVFPDNGRTFDHRAIFHQGSLANGNVVANIRHALAFVAEPRFEVLPEVLLDLLERLPRELGALKNGGVVRLRQVKQISGFEHAVTLTENAAPAKSIGPNRAANPPAQGKDV
jgi:hypothetical protein